jgi:hypothetical protein
MIVRHGIFQGGEQVGRWKKAAEAAKTHRKCGREEKQNV